MNLLVRPMEIVSKASKTDRDELFNKNYKKKYDPSILICICQLLVNFLLSFDHTFHTSSPLSHIQAISLHTWNLRSASLWSKKWADGPMQREESM